ncbi:MAG: hypothetical protein GXO16_03685 [Epsilonproteobacteria bacterium]|nr:hypothetical protein [Campylobacterota bacterium]
MLTALPVKTNKDNPALSPLFGHAKWFAFVEEGRVSIEANPYDGGVAVVEWLLHRGVDRIITQHIGLKPFMLLAREGVECFYPGEGRIELDEALKRCENGECEPISQHNIEKFTRH